MILSFLATDENGDVDTYRRAGVLPDIYTNEAGDIFQLVPVKKYLLNKQLVIKYKNTSMMAKHIVADAWRPGWEAESKQIGFCDEDPTHVHVDNLLFREQPGPGRPRNSKVYRAIQAVAAWKVTRDLSMVAEEMQLTLTELRHAIRMYAPEEAHLLVESAKAPAYSLRHDDRR